MKLAVGLSGAALMLLGGMALPFLPPTGIERYLAGLVIVAGFVLYARGVLAEEPEQE